MFSWAKICCIQKSLKSLLSESGSFQRFVFIKTRNDVRLLHCSEVCRGKPKVTAKLDTDTERKLETAEMKHRKHPGIRKTPCFTLPQNLLLAADKVMSTYEHHKLSEDIKKFNKMLWHRQLPIEGSELEMRTFDLMEKMNIQVLHDEQSVHEESMKKMSFVREQMKRQLHRWKPLDYTKYMCILYLASRLSLNYAAICKVFSEIVTEVPSFSPKTFFDFGSGVGSAVWAANEFWGRSLKQYFCVDAAAEMNSLAEILLQGGEEEAPTFIKDISFRQFLPGSSVLKYDLVVSAFSMLDLPAMKERMKVIDILWQKTEDTLVIIENGGNTGFSIILDARDYILKLAENSGCDLEEVHVVAPCPHDMECPLFVTKKICHFPVQYYPLFPKQDSTTMKKTLIAYIVLRKGKKYKESEPWPRVIKPVVQKSKRAHCHLCCADGKYREVIFSKGKYDRHTYRCARKSSHGDRLPMALTDNTIASNTSQDLEENDDSDSDDLIDEEK